MFEPVDHILQELKAFTTAFDFRCLGREDSCAMYEKLVELERLASAALALAADRMADAGGWYRTPYRSPAHYMGATEARPVNHSAYLLRTVETMHRLPEIEAAYRQGALNDEQAIEVVSAAEADPRLQGHLLSTAQAEELLELRRECARVRAAALDEQERQKRAHHSRRLRHWVDLDGAFRISGRFTVAAGAEILAALEPHRQKVADRASRKGRRGKVSSGAALADALLDMARHSSGAANDPIRPRLGAVHVNVDHSSLLRGHTVSGEVCEVPGVGPLPVSTVREWMAEGDPYVAAIRLCSWHHYLKTHHHYILKRRLGHWLWEDPGGIPPDLDDLPQELKAAGYDGTLARPG